MSGLHGLRRLSPSGIARYENCPRSFQLYDLERVARNERPDARLCQGNAIHAALERFFGLPVEDRSYTSLERALRSVWCAHRKPGAFTSREDERRCGLQALDMLRRFVEDYDIEVEPLAREQWASAHVGGVELRGKIDRIDAGPDGTLELVDYKTGRRQLDPDELPDDPAARVYLLAAEEVFQQPVSRVRLLYLQSGAEVRWSPEREDVEAMKNEVGELVAEISSTSFFEARPGPLCRYCPVALHCPERGRVSLSDLVPVENMAF
ncbi:MAG: PD-(D/E)XK nuclease family protein [Actinobacteria bacterium]|nr:PD-(D/E)XK nuclease family protein [Actinomycetota bacterium]